MRKYAEKSMKTMIYRKNTSYKIKITKMTGLFCFYIELCSSEHLPEVEIFSLLEEQIPKYKLRADTLTQFAGYQNEVSISYISCCLSRPTFYWLNILFINH